MRAVYRVADVRAAEERLMAALPPGTLMQRAAAGLARRCAVTLGGSAGRVYGAKVLLLVGSGDNGGDALYAGALLARRGAAVTAVLAGRGTGVHQGGLVALLRAGGRVTQEVAAHADLVVDGLVGIGARGPLRESMAALVERIAEGATVVAVDTPSGVDVDTGDVPGPAVRADITVTFGCLKPAHVVGPAAVHAGQVELVDIGLGPWLPEEAALRLADADDVSAWWPLPTPESDKYTRGVVGLATGSADYPGAAWLSVAGALAGPAGLVRYAGAAHQLVAQTHPSVVVAPSVAEALRVQAWVCGCGLGDSSEAHAAVQDVLASPVPVILDADALSMLTGVNRVPPTVLTPHDREYARLAGEAPGPDRVAAAKKLASSTGATIVLKGFRTVIASPDGQVWVNPTGSPILATGGTGDVLAGLLGSLLAAGVDPVRAAVMACYVHGLAGHEAARSGPVTAVEVAAALRTVIADLGVP
jgi:ADP-dependent NAD(P)H-hydrate dehydratase / NAD(P)H-hydrate epimerase